MFNKERPFLPGKTHCGTCSSKLPQEVGLARCPNCDSDPYEIPTEEEILSCQTGEKVKKILTKEDEKSDREFIKKHIKEFKEKMGW